MYTELGACGNFNFLYSENCYFLHVLLRDFDRPGFDYFNMPDPEIGRFKLDWLGSNFLSLHLKTARAPNAQLWLHTQIQVRTLQVQVWTAETQLSVRRPSN